MSLSSGSGLMGSKKSLMMQAPCTARISYACTVHFGETEHGIINIILILLMYLMDSGAGDCEGG